MRVHTYQQMLAEYEITELEPDDKYSREEMLVQFPYSVILEGGFMELDNLDKWIVLHIGSDLIKSLLYGKTGYNYCFAEYFFAEESHAMEVSKVISHIYTYYPYSTKPDQAVRSNGYNDEVVYDPRDQQAIIFRSETDEK